ncbi:hypothetical protein PZB75_15195 [Streptomyces sp. AM 4-1-1]|uniref:hypothetical protein n=1 Tax=Streptomyces sp. AM 4-1-1 TaxID=3028710 RepID=UPI0023B8C2C6|nr:hypothetical protein [Streptomyces sp. AM 4-1-1]WEH34570.1 hypothetical protein PZB75_15195 [Streptomyces sp. AM 4-1-1]
MADLSSLDIGGAVQRDLDDVDDSRAHGRLQIGDGAAAEGAVAPEGGPDQPGPASLALLDGAGSWLASPFPEIRGSSWVPFKPTGWFKSTGRFGQGLFVDLCHA